MVVLMISLVESQFFDMQTEVMEDWNDKLFFINLGGYKPGDFEEYHYKTLTVAQSMAQAVKAAKQTASEITSAGGKATLFKADLTRASEVIAPFDAAYNDEPPPPPSRAASDDRFTMDPPAGIYFTKACVTRNSDLKLRFITVS